MYNIGGVDKVEVVELAIIEGTFATHAISGVGHITQMGRVHGNNREYEHADGEEGSDDSAEHISGESVGKGDGDLGNGADFTVVSVGNDGLVGSHFRIYFIRLF